MNRILLIDDHPISLSGIAGLISDENDLEVCGETSSAEEGLELIGQLKPDLVLTDINLPGKSGLELIKDARALYPELQILVLSMHDETLYAERVLRAGGRGYLMKETKPAIIIKAIRTVLNGGVFLSEAMSAHLLEIMATQGGKMTLSPMERLSDREFEVFQLIGEGKTSGEAAEQLKISPRTVDAHKAHIKEKLSLKGANELNRYAVRWVESGQAG